MLVFWVKYQTKNNTSYSSNNKRQLKGAKQWNKIDKIKYIFEHFKSKKNPTKYQKQK